MAAKRRTARSERRAAERATSKQMRARDRLAALEEGGAPDRPMAVPSASVIEPSAASTTCARCGGRVRVESHEAKSIDGVSLRVVRVFCASCGHKRDVWFRIVSALPS